MPTQPGIASESLDPKQAQEKFAGLLTDVGDTETPEPQEPVSQPEPSEPPLQSSETEPPDEEKYEVKVDGEPVIVDLDELKAGYSRDADYRRKTMSLAEERRAFEAEQQAVQSERQRYLDGLKQIEQALTELQGEPNWDELRKSLPASDFLERKADWEHQRLNRDRLKAEQDRVSQQAQSEQQQQWQKYLKSEQEKLRAAIPEWSEPEVMKTDHDKIVQVAKQYGYTEQEVRSVVDHRAIRVLRDAMKYRELHREPTPAVKAKVSAIKTAKPGTPERPRPNAKFEKLAEQVAKSGRQRDAVAAILAGLPDD